MPVVSCKICKKDFYSKPSWLKKGKGIYCSDDCYRISRRKGKLINCFVCGKTVYKTLRLLSKSKNKKYFCSKLCSNRWLGKQIRGLKHPNWKSGESSYKEVLKRETNSMMCVLCRTEDQRVLAVHHIDKNRQNNSIENLTWLCHNCHFLVHHYIKEKAKFVQQNKTHATR